MSTCQGCDLGERACGRDATTLRREAFNLELAKELVSVLCVRESRLMLFIS